MLRLFFCALGEFGLCLLLFVVELNFFPAELLHDCDFSLLRCIDTSESFCFRCERVDLDEKLGELLLVVGEDVVELLVFFEDERAFGFRFGGFIVGFLLFFRALLEELDLSLL